jgi:hypothetical protein
LTPTTVSIRPEGRAGLLRSHWTGHWLPTRMPCIRSTTGQMPALPSAARVPARLGGVVTDTRRKGLKASAVGRNEAGTTARGWQLFLRHCETLPPDEWTSFTCVRYFSPCVCIRDTEPTAGREPNIVAFRRAHLFGIARGRCLSSVFTPDV